MPEMRLNKDESAGLIDGQYADNESVFAGPHKTTLSGDGVPEVPEVPDISSANPISAGTDAPCPPPRDGLSPRSQPRDGGAGAPWLRGGLACKLGHPTDCTR